MKYLFLVLLMLLSVLLKACAGTNTHQVQSRQYPTSAAQLTPESEDDPGILEDFVNDINNHQAREALDLFNDDAVVTEIDQVGLGSNLAVPISPVIYTGKDQIASWLNQEVEANLQIVPRSYQAAGNTAN